MKAIRKLKMVLLLILMASVGSLMAQTYPSWNKEKKGEFTIDQDYTLTSSITLTGNLTLHVAPNGGQGFYIRRGSSFTGDMFNVSGTSSSKVYKLTILGTENDTIYIDGGAVYNTPGDARSGLVSGKAGRAIDVADYGALELRYVVIQNCYNNTGTEGAGIHGNNATSKLTDMILYNCTFRGNFARYHASVLHYNDAARFQAHMKECRAYHNYSSMERGEGGTIRCEGGAKSIMEIDSCEICYNYTKWNGAGISWYGGGSQDAKLRVTHNTKVHHNVAEGNGGGVYLGATAQIVSAEIYNNEAYGYGGGVDMHTYGGPLRNYNGKGLRITIDENVSIHDNISRKGGGGMWVHLYPSRFLGFNSNDNAINVDSTKNIVKVVEGAQIYNNHAPFGGGIYLLDELPYRFQNPVSEAWSKELKREVTIEGGDIYNNYAEHISSSISACYGGGIFLHKKARDGVSYGTSSSGARGAGTLNVNITGGNIHDNYAMSDLQNGCGGGVAIKDTFTKNNSYCNVTIGGTAHIYSNQCDKNGGGLHIESLKTSGDGVLSVKVNGGTVGGTSLAEGNKALGGNGGGISVASGNLIVDGGIINYNQALANGEGTGNGGAFSVEGGYAVISGGSVSYNQAANNGGGFYLDAAGGITDTIKEGAVLSYNQAANGAGLYVGQGSIYIDGQQSETESYSADFETGDFSQLDFTNDDEYFPWIVTTDDAHNGTYSIKNSNSGEHNSTSTISLNMMFVEDGSVSFWAKCQGEGTNTFYDHCDFSIDGEVEITHGADVNGWQYYTLPVTAGAHTFVWSYTKNASVNPEGDSFFVDDIVFTGAGSFIEFTHNIATSKGGGICANGGNVTVLGNVSINSNMAENYGGGVYVAGGDFIMNEGIIGGTVEQGNYTTALDGRGGGLYMGGGTATLSGGTLSGNTATNGYGGGIYMEGGTCTLSGGANIGGENANYANNAKFGGGIYSAGGDITVSGGHIDHNNATADGGGIYSNGPEATVVITKEGTEQSYLQYNTAINGGGIYANRGVVNFSDGFIQYNYASGAGGGMYVNDNGGNDFGTLYLKGSANLYRNHVPEGHNGGGVYLKGKVIVGEEENSHGLIRAQENFAGDEYIYTWTNTGHPATDSIDQVTANNRNNIFLPDPTVNGEHKGVITVIEGGITDESRVGFSVPRNYVPVIYCAPSPTSHDYLNQFSTGHESQYKIFDDSRHYVAVYYSDKPEIFDPNHVYLYGFWSNIVTGQPDDPCYVDPSTFDPMDISTPCELAFFISYVNGLNGQTANPSADGKLTADIDMSEYGWVPIGHLTDGYQGTFDGNGHTITGISSLLYREYLDYGFFGRLNGGTVKNLFVEESVYAIESKDGIIIGGLAAEATGNSVVENSEVRATIVGDHPNTIMGGLIGRMGDVREATSSDWSVPDGQVPVNGTRADHFQKSEFVIPASELEGMEGALFTSVQFFLTTPASRVWQDATFQIFLKPSSGTTLSSFSGTDGATMVYSGALDATGYTMRVNFSTPYIYTGGNLLVGVYETTPGESHSALFQGVGADNVSLHGENASSLDAITAGSPVNFRPKTVFSASAQEALVDDGTTTNTSIPVNGSKITSFNKMEFIVPAAELKKVEGGSLDQMQFFLSSQASNTWGNAEFRVFLKEVNGTTVDGFSGTDDATVVYEGKLFGNAPTMTVDFTTPYEYNGGNLLVGIYQYKKGGTNRAATFVGVEAENAAIYGSNGSNINNVVGIVTHFRPKTVFGVAGTVVHDMVCDGATTNQSIPVCGSSANKYQKNEFVIPASDLAEMVGAEVSSMKFYLTSPARTVWGDASFQVFLKEVEGTTVSGFSGLEGATLVYDGVLNATGSTMVVYFDNMYTYQGGNLLVGVYQTVSGTGKEATFAGIGVANAGVHGESASGLDAITEGTIQDFRPKTVFGYTPVSAMLPQIHSTIAIGNLSGFLMGGLVGQIVNGTLSNSFANSKFTSKGSTQYIGGLVGINRGTVENSYARLRDNITATRFGILVGDNTNGTVNYCYAPEGMENYTKVGNAPNGSGNYGVTHLPYLYKHHDTQVSATNDYVSTEAEADNQMMNVLNRWVDTINSKQSAISYTRWGRPWQVSDSNKPLNDDYPILKMPLNDAVAAKTGDPYLYYSPIDTLLVKYTAADEAIWMYRNNASVNGENADSGTKLYIAEDVALINSHPLKAYVGITLDNSAGVNGANPQGGVATAGMTDATDWHMISTPLSDAPLGINYNGDEAQHGFSWDHPDGMPYYRFYPKDDTLHGYFPSMRYDWASEHGFVYNPSAAVADDNGNYYTEWDFYSYDEPQYHWINFKRNSASHWHMDDPDPAHMWEITYENEDSLVPGKGYFAATREETFLQCQGHLNNEAVTYGLTQTLGVPRHGYNLLGNPYQAYLDFYAFAAANVGGDESIWDDLSTASYTIIDEDSARYVTYAYRGSDNPAYAGRYLHPHQGFFVLLRDRDQAKAYFRKEMRDAMAEGVTFRSDGHVNYPLVNLFVKEASGNSDMVTVELGRPDKGGAPLMQGLRTGNGKIWCHYNDEDWAIAYTQPGISEVGIRFESVEDTEYTLRWDTHNGEFGYLHLIDNMTGADVDCLTTDEYKFSASPSDYKSRFRLVFGYTGIEENDAEATETSFAFMTGDELVVTGEGVFQMFDLNGRLVASRELHGVQSTVSLPDVSNGVYVLRLTEGKQSRVQKMVISK